MHTQPRVVLQLGGGEEWKNIFVQKQVLGSRMIICEYRILRRIFGPKRTRNWVNSAQDRDLLESPCKFVIEPPGSITQVIICICIYACMRFLCMYIWMCVVSMYVSMNVCIAGPMIQRSEKSGFLI